MTDTDDTDDAQTDQSIDDASTTADDRPLGSATDSETNSEGATNDGSATDSAMTDPTTGSSSRSTDHRDRYYDTTRSPREYLELLALIGLGLFAAVSAYGFYVNANQAIAQLVAATYESLFQAAFNLTLLFLALAGLSLLARRRLDLL